MLLIKPITYLTLKDTGLSDNDLRLYIERERGTLDADLENTEWEIYVYSGRFAIGTTRTVRIVIHVDPEQVYTEAMYIAKAADAIRLNALLNNPRLRKVREDIRDYVKTVGEGIEYQIDTIAARVDHKLWFKLYHGPTYGMGKEVSDQLYPGWLDDALDGNYPKPLADLFKVQFEEQKASYLERNPGSQVGIHYTLEHFPVGMKICVKVGEVDKPGYITQFNIIDCIDNTLKINPAVKSLIKDFT